MLVDSHCHLDFPDFADELDARGRARARRPASAASSRSRPGCAGYAELLAIAERFPDVFCSVGTHPHHAHEELDVAAADLVARTRHPKVVAIGEAGLDYHYDNSPRAAQEQGFRAPHRGRARDRPAAGDPLARRRRRHGARSCDEETGKGAFPAVLHCFTGGRELACAGDRARPLRLVHRHPDVQEIRRAARHRRRRCRPTASWSRPTRPISRPARYRGKRNEPAYVVETAKVLAEVRGVSLDEIARQTTENFFRLFRKVPRPACGRRMTLTFTILGCGSSGGVPRPALGWGACDPNNPKNRRRRSSLLVERRGAGGPHPRPGRHLARPARAAARRRRRLARRRALHPRARRPHPRHRRSARAVHAQAPARRRLCSTSRPRELLRRALRLLLRDAARQRLSADPDRAPDRRRPAGDDRRARAARSPLLPYPAGARRHPLARLPLRRPRLFLRPERPAGRERWRRSPASTSGSSTRCATRRTRATSASPTRWPGSSASSRGARS